MKIKEKLTAALELLSYKIIKFSNKEARVDQEFRLIIGKNIETKEKVDATLDARYSNRILSEKLCSFGSNTGWIGFWTVVECRRATLLNRS